MSQMKRIILKGSDYIPTIEYYLMVRHPHVGENRVQLMMAEILNALIEAIRERHSAMPNVVEFCHRIHDNMTLTPAFSIQSKQLMLRAIRDLAMDLLYQAEEFKLYDDQGRLMYSFYFVQDPSFKDVALSSILQLTWNRGYYEPIL